MYLAQTRIVRQYWVGEGRIQPRDRIRDSGKCSINIVATLTGERVNWAYTENLGLATKTAILVKRDSLDGRDKDRVCRVTHK